MSISVLMQNGEKQSDTFPGMTLAENVKRLREAQKLSQRELADLVGVQQPTIAQIEAGISKTTKHIFKLAKVLGVDVDALDPEAFVSAPSTGPAIKAGEIVGNARDFPIYTAAEGGQGAIVVTWEPIEWTVRPAPLLNVRGGYGIYVVGDSMSPAYEPGDIALVNPHLPPSPGRDVVFFKSDSGNTTEGLIKRLAKTTTKEWHVQQWTPAKSFTLLRTEWPQCQAVIGKYGR